MKFYSGFSLKNDAHFFNNFIKNSKFTVSGFSYGAIKAFLFAKEQLEAGKRVDTLQLFSPAFFQTKSDKFKRLQHISYMKSKEKYLLGFLKGCFSPYNEYAVEQIQTNIEELDELLSYEWLKDELRNLEDKGLVIEVYLGGEDKIIDVASAKDFFVEVATLTYIKNANHFLQIN